LVNIIVLSLDEGLENLVLTFTIIAKTISNVGWFIMWVQAIEVNNNNNISFSSDPVTAVW
jgi:hypothetical protein